MPIRRNPKQIDRFDYNGEILLLWLMPNSTLLLLRQDSATNRTLEQYNSRKDALDEIGMANKFDEIKERMIKTNYEAADI